MGSLVSRRVSALNGSVRVPGDKSISHRSLMIAALAYGVSNIEGLLEGEDVLATAAALRQMGVDINRDAKGVWHVIGVGVGGLKAPSDVIDMHNAGTGVRLLMGLVSSYPFKTVFTGDASLRSRPMHRVMKPLQQMGINFDYQEGGKLPIVVHGTSDIMPIDYQQEVASAQVKSAIILAGLNCPGKTSVTETVVTRDHTELMLRGFGADIEVSDLPSGARKVTVTGFPKLKACDIDVPSDPSSAAFLVVAALITDNSELLLQHVCVNPLRDGLFHVLKQMGGKISYENERILAGESVADIRVKSSKLKGVVVPESMAAKMIDEYPILSVAAACAAGETKMLGVAELRVKESDRLLAIVNGLKASDVAVDYGDDWFVVKGKGQTKSVVKGGAVIKTNMDHRIAMSFLVLGMVSEQPITVDDGAMIKTSFPGFEELVNKIGGNINAK